MNSGISLLADITFSSVRPKPSGRKLRLGNENQTCFFCQISDTMTFDVDEKNPPPHIKEEDFLSLIVCVCKSVCECKCVFVF